MRIRSCGVSASNMEEYLSKIKEIDNNYIEESTLTYFGFISLEEESNNNDEYELLGHKSNYKMSKIEKKRKMRKKVRINQYFRKKIFFHHKRSRINSESTFMSNN